MMIRELAVFGTVVLIWSSFSDCAGMETRKAATEKLSLKEQVAALPPGSAVVVKTRDKRTLKGTLGGLSDSGFELQRINKTANNETLSFADVKSVKVKPSGMSTGAAIAIGAAIVVGFVLILAVWGLAKST